MSRTIPMPFQKRHIASLVDRFVTLKASYDALGAKPDPAQLKQLRTNGACVMLQAPTGIGKTLMASEFLASFSPVDRVLWFWFAPFTGVLSQSQATLKRQAPSLTQLNVDADRQVEKLVPGAIFVLSWQTVATRAKENRVARQSGDSGLAIDDLIAQARHEGYRIGVVVDEAHHGFVRAAEAGKFFSQVLAPEYVLLMTATPRDEDATKFSRQTGYRIGGPEEWASVSRAEGVDAQLLKRSVKAARFIAQNQDDAQLLAFEEVAMAEAAAMHRLIKKTLTDAGVGLVPLMLVQVPNGGEMLEKAKNYLTNTLRFPAEAVRTHTSEEPDPKLSALAEDPQVEVILFKMAIATGFDAPRAFTLAALRGARDASFGVQVVGRIMRVHRLLQGRLNELPPLLQYGYVYLANGEAQEGLLNAAAQINQMPGQLAAASPATVVTFNGNALSVQVTKPGQSFVLFPEGPPVAATAEPASAGAGAFTVLDTSVGAEAPAADTPPTVYRDQVALFQVLAATQDPLERGAPRGTGAADATAGDTAKHGLARGYADSSALSHAFELEAQTSGFSYALRTSAPRSVITEALPPLPEDFERRLVQHIDFARVLGDRLKVRTRVTERTTDVFVAATTPDDKDVWASVSPEAIATRARQIAFAFDDVDRRELLRELRTRFREVLVNEGHEPPATDEELTRQLELVLVRNDKLIRDAHKRLRAEQVTTAVVHLPTTVASASPLTPAARNVYGVFPDDLGPQELEFAELLDTSQQILWWHRNPVKKPWSVGLYGWADGTGFYPDFVVGVVERTEGDGIALSEVKGLLISAQS